jgi:hypothetical protein
MGIYIVALLEATILKSIRSSFFRSRFYITFQWRRGYFKKYGAAEPIFWSTGAIMAA